MTAQHYSALLTTAATALVLGSNALAADNPALARQGKIPSVQALSAASPVPAAVA